MREHGEAVFRILDSRLQKIVQSAASQLGCGFKPSIDCAGRTRSKNTPMRNTLGIGLSTQQFRRTSAAIEDENAALVRGIENSEYVPAETAMIGLEDGKNA